jgi:hypothetical protein
VGANNARMFYNRAKVQAYRVYLCRSPHVHTSRHIISAYDLAPEVTQEVTAVGICAESPESPDQPLLWV